MGHCPNDAGPKVSFVVPCYNARRYLNECLSSIVETATEPYEVVVVDDGSTEEIRDIVDAFGPQVRYIRQPNQGPGAARNTGIQKTTSPYIRFVDADDILLSADALDAQLSMLEGHPDLGLIYGQSVIINADGQQQGLRKPRFAEGDYIRPGAEELNQLLLYNYITTSTTLIRRSTLAQAGLFCTELRAGQDYELWIRIARIAAIGYVAQPVAAYRKHATGVTARKTLAQRHQLFEAIDRHFLDPEFALRYAGIRSRIEARRTWYVIAIAYRSGRINTVRKGAAQELMRAVRYRDWDLARDYIWLVAKSYIPLALQQHLRHTKRQYRMT